MVYSKVEALSPSQENTREAFISYLRNVVGRKGKTPIHLNLSHWSVAFKYLQESV